MSLWSRLVRTVSRSRHDQDIDEEIAFHLAMKAQATADDRQARLRFGNPAVVREDMRDAGIVVWLDSVLRDMRYALAATPPQLGRHARPSSPRWSSASGRIPRSSPSWTPRC